jgi:hypothetical protein
VPFDHIFLGHEVQKENTMATKETHPSYVASYAFLLPFNKLTKEIILAEKLPPSIFAVPKKSETAIGRRSFSEGGPFV